MTRLRMLAASLVALNIATAANAQNAPSPAPAQGPLIVERIHNAIVVAPDYKVTDVNGDFGQLAGAYVGRMLDDQLLIGGAGYWLANGTRGTDLGYGGLLIGWSTAPGRIRFGARGLVGGGRGTLTLPLETRLGGRIDPRVLAAGAREFVRFGARVPPLAPGASLPSFRVREDLFVFEPQLNTVTKVTNHLALDVAVGYRLIGLTDVLGDRLDGATGSLGLQFGW